MKQEELFTYCTRCHKFIPYYKSSCPSGRQDRWCGKCAMMYISQEYRLLRLLDIAEGSKKMRVGKHPIDTVLRLAADALQNSVNVTIC
ncbi:hypothetical protein UFOVP276_215 [uncultured Caudovirales phage]|uniref:Uncharacterized protein n=1 Tax=uncultured Caudovirales phage TaxID=2100421 RepID=A0A6J5LAV2_9CAUD|nr:hypothetical protein UFOVP127_109 [uncultured Caudovirales phage]CAB4135259.1 hypothetical protein UFOVP276_215 [uncultured Caudovirales phage]